jgi:hypothetical protein
MDKKLKKQLQELREKGEADNRFDINLQEGKYAEELVKKLLSGAYTIEVKKDYAVSRTGNVAVEVLHDGLPSGLVTSQADFYAFVLGGTEYNDDIILFIRKERLWRIVEKMIVEGKLRYAQKRGESDFVPVPLIRLIEKESKL